LTLGAIDLLRAAPVRAARTSRLTAPGSIPPHTGGLTGGTWDAWNAALARLCSEAGVEFQHYFDDVEYPTPTARLTDITDRLLQLAAESDVVYLVPGHPVLTDPASIRLYAAAQAAGIETRIRSLDPIPFRDGLSDFASLVEVMARLRDPDGGCPWDLEQTPLTLRRYLVEEAYEAIEAIDAGVPMKIAEELGDLMLQVVFHARLAGEAGDFGIDDVVQLIVDKLVRRHPHVFGDVYVENADQVLVNWEAIKRAEKGNEDRRSILDGIPRDLPALMRALEVSRRVVKVGFEWPGVDGVLDKVEEELNELRAELAVGDSDRAGAEFGDLLFTLVNVARHLKIDPEQALREMTVRFSNRFRHIEEHAAATGRAVDQLSLAEMEAVWQAAKRLP
ncbi:MAG: nucleoside triphosphate pyrophosphohydrolase, partial [Capsulimonadaceae bacterium]